MILGREILVEIEAIAKTQKRIYQDACDYGIPATPTNCGKMRNLMLKLANECGNGQRRVWVNGTSFEVFIPIEHDEGAIQGTLVKTSFHNLTRKPGPFLSIDVTRESRPLQVA